MRLILLCILSVFVFSYEQSRLEMHAKVFEKILLLNAELKQKVDEGKRLTVIVLHDETEEIDATHLKRYLIEASRHKGFPYTIDVMLKTYDAFSNETANAYFFLDGASKKRVSEVAQFAIHNRIVTFAYNYDYLALGVMLSLGIDKKVYPVLNPEAIRESKINFNPILIRIAKKYQP